MAIKLNVFQGIKPKVEPRLIGPSTAQIAHDCSLESGAIVPLKDNLPSETLTQADVKTIYPYNGSWLEWLTAVNVVDSPLADDQYDRIYYTGDGGAPKIRFLYNGDERERKLGVPKPSSAPGVWVRNRSSRPFTLKLHYFYEEPDGTQNDTDTETLESTFESYGTYGRIYQNTTAKPTRHAASSEAIFMPYVEFYSEDDVLLGTVYPSDSKFVGNSDMSYGGREVILEINRRSASGSDYVDVWVQYGAAASDSDTTSRSYVYTFVDILGEEGPPSDASDIVDMDPTKDAKLTLADNGSAHTNIVTLSAKRIYRTVTSTAGTAYQFVAEIGITETTHIDYALDSEMAETIPSIGWLAPDEGLDGLVSLPGGFLAAFSGHTVYFSEPNFPHAWPVAYAVGLDAEIVGLSVSGSTLMVMTTSTPYMITVVDPGSATVTKIPAFQGCLSKRSIFEIGGAVGYASQDGLVVLQGQTALLFSESVFSKSDWLSYSPETMFAAVYDNNVFLFSDTAALMFPLTQELPQVVTLSERPTAAYYDEVTDAMYLAVGTTLYTFAGSDDNRAVTWRSREYFETRPHAPTVARVVAETYPVTLNLIAAGSEVLSRAVSTDEAFRLPVLRKEKAWSFEIQSDYEVYEALISTGMSDL